ncbi:MAG: hypothetical protein MZV65_40975 [Chromatiales bacterium]|nr:hypothetical protein [Chromatiales bacterium]
MRKPKKAQDWTLRFPDDIFGWKIMGSILAASQRHQEAVSALKHALKLAPEDAEGA